MKILIWFLCIFASSAITTLFGMRGVRLGAIPTVILYVGTFWLAKTLCRKWDEHKEEQDPQEDISDSTPTSTSCESRVQTTEIQQTSDRKTVNKSNQPMTAEIRNGEKVCPACGLSQKANRSVCWNCGQQFDN